MSDIKSLLNKISNKIQETSTYSKEKSDKHGEVSIEAEMVKHFFEVPEHAGEHDFYTSSQIKNIIETNSVQRLSVKKLGMELKRLGYIRYQKSGHGFGYRISMKHPNLQRNEPDPF
jgi:hypothetical protein